MFGISSRYVKAKIKAPAFHIICKYNLFLSVDMQGKNLASSPTKSGNFAEQRTSVAEGLDYLQEFCLFF